MTKTEKQHLSRVAELGCLICKSEAEIHHLRTGQGMGVRASNYEVIPLCFIHHRGGGYGVAFHQGKKAFEDKFGTESELLEKTLRILKYGS